MNKIVIFLFVAKLAAFAALFAITGCSQVEPIGNAFSDNSDNLKKAAVDIGDSTVKVIKPAAKWTLEMTAQGINYVQEKLED